MTNEPHFMDDKMRHAVSGTCPWADCTLNKEEHAFSGLAPSVLMPCTLMAAVQCGEDQSICLTAVFSPSSPLMLSKPQKCRTSNYSLTTLVEASTSQGQPRTMQWFGASWGSLLWLDGKNSPWGRNVLPTPWTSTPENYWKNVYIFAIKSRQ